MKIIKPITVTDAVLAASTVEENEWSPWDADYAYAVGDRVVLPATHRVYESLQDENTGNDPQAAATYWLDLGATNRWAMFDGKVGTRSVADGSLSVVLNPLSVASGLALMELECTSVTVMVNDLEPVEYQLTEPISAPDWWCWFFEPIVRRTQLVLTSLPAQPRNTITVTLNGFEGFPVACGVCVIGQALGFAEAVRYGAAAGITDYSRKSVDEWGNFEIVERAFAKRASWSFLCRNEDMDALVRTLAAVRAIPAVYIGSDRYESTTVYGFFKDFDVVIAYARFCECSIDIEGLI